jgi:hypothetical protein
MSAGEIRKKILVCVMVYTALGSIWKTENVWIFCIRQIIVHKCFHMY